jgi:hypothetical protein
MQKPCAMGQRQAEEEQAREENHYSATKKAVLAQCLRFHRSLPLTN